MLARSELTVTGRNTHTELTRFWEQSLRSNQGQPHDPYPDQGIAETDGKPRTQGRRDIWSPLEQECAFKGTVKGLLEAMAYEGKDVP